jgi:hypothetical protein
MVNIELFGDNRNSYNHRNVGWLYPLSTMNTADAFKCDQLHQSFWKAYVQPAVLMSEKQLLSTRVSCCPLVFAKTIGSVIVCLSSLGGARIPDDYYLEKNDHP